MATKAETAEKTETDETNTTGEVKVLVESVSAGAGGDPEGASAAIIDPEGANAAIIDPGGEDDVVYPETVVLMGGDTGSCALHNYK